MEQPASAYLLCATPRTGSTLLCGLLTSSGVAGRPESYFNRTTLDHYADAWHVPRPDDGTIDAAFVRAASIAGRTPNGVFGGRLMAESRPGLIDGLARSAPRPRPSDVDLLEGPLGPLRFVHLRRRDVVAQAVSWAKALQTHFWHPGEAVTPGGEDPHYDEELIGRLARSIQTFESGWASWFATQRVVPFEVTYEELAADPVHTAGEVLAYLGLDLPPGRQLVVGHHRQADERNADWVARFAAHRSGA